MSKNYAISQLEEVEKLSIDELRNDSVIIAIEETAEDDQYENEPMAAREFYEVIENLLVKYGGQINGTDIYRRLYAIKTRLFWQGLPAMDKKLKKESLHENLIYALKNNIEVASYIDSYLHVFEFGVGPDNDERRMFVNSLTINEEPIGSQPIKFKTGESVRNTVTNWIKDYLSYADPTSIKGESYEMTQYMFSSPNVKTLSPDDKILLSKVLSIYNLLKNPKYIPVIEPEETQPAPSKPATASFIPPQASKPAMDMPKPLPVSPYNTPAPTTMTEKEMTAFEKKLAQVSVPAPEKALNLEVLKQSKPATMSVEEIKREIKARELPASEVPKVTASKLPVKMATPPVRPTPPTAPKPSATFVSSKIAESKLSAPAPIPRSMASPRPTPSVMSNLSDNLTEIKKLDDLKKIDVGHLRRGPLLQQIDILKNKIISIARANRIIPFYALSTFEESPLFKMYLAHGNAMFAGQTISSGLTPEEFGAIADLRREIQKS
jgi:hypothetical protein